VVKGESRIRGGWDRLKDGKNSEKETKRVGEKIDEDNRERCKISDFNISLQK
jgi:hypothetical protein